MSSSKSKFGFHTIVNIFKVCYFIVGVVLDPDFNMLLAVKASGQNLLRSSLPRPG
jgi:hypothetical protein